MDPKLSRSELPADVEVEQGATGGAAHTKEAMKMLKYFLAPAIVLLALLAPASAQQTEEGTAMTPAECRTLFSEVDANGDGVLSQQEIAAADVGDLEAGTTLSQFMADCQG